MNGEQTALADDSARDAAWPENRDAIAFQRPFEQEFGGPRKRFLEPCGVDNGGPSLRLSFFSLRISSP
jgi:hypothetical protein